MDVTDLSEEFDREIYPAKGPGNPNDCRSPEQLLETSPRPAPILFVLLIVFWLWVPFIASVVFLVVILGIFAAAENPSDLHSLRLRGSLTGLTSVGESLGLKNLSSVLGRSSGLWDASNFVKIWNQLLDSSPALHAIRRDARAVAATQVDWIETGDAHVFKADMPGLKKEDVKVELEGESILQISGQRSKVEDDEDERESGWHRLERSHGRFLRRFQLPVNSKVHEVQAKVENGVLTVTVPKIRKQETLATREVVIE